MSPKKKKNGEGERERESGKKEGIEALQAFPGGAVLKNPPSSVGDLGDTGSIRGLRRSLGVGNGIQYSEWLQYSCLEIPWTEEPGKLQSMGSQRVRHD